MTLEPLMRDFFNPLYRQYKRRFAALNMERKGESGAKSRQMARVMWECCEDMGMPLRTQRDIDSYLKGYFSGGDR